jgi:hypothetical protein
VEEEPPAEGIIQFTANSDLKKWTVTVLVIAQGGELVADGSDSGVLDDEGALTRTELLGIAVDRGLTLLAGMEVPPGTIPVVEACTWAGGVLRVGVGQFVSRGLFEPRDSDPDKHWFRHSWECWQRVVLRLRPKDGSTPLKIRWVHPCSHSCGHDNCA